MRSRANDTIPLIEQNSFKKKLSMQTVQKQSLLGNLSHCFSNFATFFTFVLYIYIYSHLLFFSIYLFIFYFILFFCRTEQAPIRQR